MVTTLGIDIVVDDIEPQLSLFETVIAKEIDQHVGQYVVFINNHSVMTDDVTCVKDNDCTMTTNNVSCVTTKDNKSKTKHDIIFNCSIYKVPHSVTVPNYSIFCSLHLLR